MMRFDWKKFCDQRSIPYVEQGPNTARGNISIKCPLCGNADPSEHMGLKLDSRDPQWGCLRNPSHRGVFPQYLVAKLLKINMDAANSLVESHDRTPIDEFAATIDRLKNPEETGQISRWLGSSAPPAISLSEPIRPLVAGFYADRFLSYLTARGFENNSADVAERFELHFCLTGFYAWRLIFPIRAEDGTLHGWTGRSINGSPVRYKATDGLGKDVLYVPQYPGEKTRYLVVCEGPLDAIKLQYYGGDKLCAVALMGTSWTDGQLLALVQLARKHDVRIALLWDRDAFIAATTLADALGAHMGCSIFRYQVSAPYNDPGEMPAGEIRALCNVIVNPHLHRRRLSPVK